MSGRIVTLPDGRQRHVGGRKRAVSRGPRLSLKNYLDLSKLIAPVPDCDYTNFPGFTDVEGNDTLGDCTCAGIAHILMAINAAAGTPIVITANQTKLLYQLACGWDPNNSAATDQGGDELTVLDFVAEKGIDGNGLHKILGSILIDATNQLEVRWAIYNLCNAYKGQGLPDSYVNPFPDPTGTVWDVAGPADPNNGHCTASLGTNSQGTIDNTWGDSVIQTYAATGMYCYPANGGELHTLITNELILACSQKNPPGTFGLQDLLSDLAAIGAISS